jgi:hypothetical protein
MVTSLIVIVAFAQMYYIAARSSPMCTESYEQGDVPWQCDAGWTLFQSLAMLLTTNYKFLTMDSADQRLLTIVSFCFALIVGILREFCCFVCFALKILLHPLI